MRDKAQRDPEFVTRLLKFITSVTSEIMPFELIDETNPEPGYQVFQPLLRPGIPEFDDIFTLHLFDIIRSRQMHSDTHTSTCFKYGTTTCRSRFPRQLVPHSSIDSDMGIIRLQRDHQWLNGYHPLLSVIMRANHDIQVLLTRDHLLASIYYIIKYISKPEATLHSKLTLAAAVSSALQSTISSNTITGKQMLLKVYNKVESHREVGVPEAISHLLDFPDHLTHATFQSVQTSHLLNHLRQLASEHYDNEPSSEIPDSAIVKVGSGYALVSLFDDYACRGPGLSGLCLYDYISLFYKRKRQGGIRFTSNHPQHGTHTQFLRDGPPAIPTLNGSLFFLKPDSSDENIREDYHCIITGLFFPWQTNHLIKPFDVSWEFHFETLKPMLSPRLLRHISNLLLLHKSREESIIDRLQQQASSALSLHDMNIFSSDESHNYFDDDIDNETTNDVSISVFIDQAIRRIHTAMELDFYVCEAVESNSHNGYFNLFAHSISPGLQVLDLPRNVVQRSLDYVSHQFSIANGSQQMSGLTHSSTSTREPTIFLSQIASISSFIEQYHFNTEQAAAFNIIARHTICDDGAVNKQLLMGIFGEGGTGKSHLIRAIREWFEQLNRSSELIVTASTGTAAASISGTTLHSAVGIPVENGDVNRTSRVSSVRAAEWSERKYLIIDEISMIDTKVFLKLHNQLGKLKSNPDAKFGGLNLIVLGDFLQFPAVSHLDLYMNVNPNYSLGHHLWRSLNAVIILSQQMRQADDPAYGALLSRLRRRSPTDDDINILNSRIRTQVPSQNIPPVIVRRHSVRQAINHYCLEKIRNSRQSDLLQCVATVLERKKMRLEEVYSIMYPSANSKADAILNLLPGIPLMITTNINVLLGKILP